MLKKILLLDLAVLMTFFVLGSCVTSGICHEAVDWLTKFDWSGKNHYQKTLIIQEVNGNGQFEVTLASDNNKLLALITKENFEIEILPPLEPV